jgi:hypothetical protein
VPTYARTSQFERDHATLIPEERVTFRRAVQKFIEVLESRTFRAGLRVKGVQGAPGVFEMTWAPDGRATWQYGEPILETERHVIWRRIGGHEIFGNP